MRLFHVSDDPDIEVFEPRTPKRDDLDKNVPLVWAVSEEKMPILMTPRDCPRVVYNVGRNTSDADREKFFASSKTQFVLVIEGGWLERMKTEVLTVYEFDTADFVLQDELAGYYVAAKPQKPVAKFRVDDLLRWHTEHGVEVRLTDNLWDTGDAVRASTLEWHLCRMRNALPRDE